MIELQNGIREFHVKHGFPVDLPIVEPEYRTRMMLKITRWVLRSLSKMLLKFSLKDLPNREETYRVHLIIEETEELARGLEEGNIITIADGLGDLLYVSVGVGVAYWLPCKEICDDIQRSNMTKDVRKKTDKRLRNKGASYQPPQLDQAIGKGRGNNAYLRR